MDHRTGIQILIIVQAFYIVRESTEIPLPLVPGHIQLFCDEAYLLKSSCIGLHCILVLFTFSPTN